MSFSGSAREGEGDGEDGGDEGRGDESGCVVGEGELDEVFGVDIFVVRRVDSGRGKHGWLRG